jgi:hypothetical protein
VNSLAQWHVENHEDLLQGRYISTRQIAPLMDRLKLPFKVEVVGYSVEKNPIQTIKIGSGSHKILMWSQMHGNESTTTKAIFDLLKAFSDLNAPAIIGRLLEECTLCIIPQLNPDGANAYTRLNASQVDLNRDAQLLSQPESRVLREVYDTFKPDICFNLHGQRTIYGFASTGEPSIVSFLAPAGDDTRSIPLSRKRAMSIISHIHKGLDVHLKQRIGRYDDGFNINCTGDTFASEDVPTVLFEAGHFPQDYKRETVRRFVFLAVVAGIEAVVHDLSYDIMDYQKIPEHQKCYRDIIINNAKGVPIAIQFEEILENDRIAFVPKVDCIGGDERFFGHRIINVNDHNITHIDGRPLMVGDVVFGVRQSDGITITLS